MSDYIHDVIGFLKSPELGRKCASSPDARAPPNPKDYGLWIYLLLQNIGPINFI